MENDYSLNYALNHFRELVPLKIEGDAVVIDQNVAKKLFDEVVSEPPPRTRAEWEKEIGELHAYAKTSLAKHQEALRKHQGNDKFSSICRDMEQIQIDKYQQQIEEDARFKPKAGEILRAIPLDAQVSPEMSHQLYDAYCDSYIKPTLDQHGRLPPVGKEAEFTEDVFVMVSPDATEKVHRFGRKLPYDREIQLKQQVEIVANWEYMRRALVQAGATVYVVNGQNHYGTDRKIFPRDPLIVMGDTAYVPLDSRVSAEQPPLVKALRAHCKKIVDVDAAAFEGGNVVYDPKRDVIYLGISSQAREIDHSENSEIAALHKATGKRVIPISLPNTEYYHLDTMMAVLPGGEVIVAPKGTDKQSMALVQAMTPEKDLFLIDDPQHQLKTNIVLVENTILANAIDDDLCTTLTERGYKVIEGSGRASGDTGREFRMMNGGLRCAVQKITPDKAPEPKKAEEKPLKLKEGDGCGSQVTHDPSPISDIFSLPLTNAPWTIPLPSGNRNR
jgi:N-dimethylarginine dimethylaminohydrolase/ribosomal protein L31E